MHKIKTPVTRRIQDNARTMPFYTSCKMHNDKKHIPDYIEDRALGA